MVSFLRLGTYRLSCLAWLVVVSTWLVVVSTGFADFGQTDKNALYNINNMIGTIDTLLNHATDGNYPPSFYVRDDYTHTHLADILTLLESYTSHDYSSILDSIDTTLSDTGDTVTDIKDTLEDIYDSFGGITNSINKWGLSVSNAIANLNLGTGGLIYTNFPALLGFIDNDENEAKYLLWSLLGREPSDSEAEYFYYAYKRGGVGSWVSYLLRYFIDEGSLPDDLYDDYISSIPFSSLYAEPYPLSDDLLYSFAAARYYEYGTRPLLEYFEQATNDYVLANSDVINVDDGVNSSFSQRFVSSVGSLASSFAPSVNTNIATVATNDIVNIEDDGYASKYEEIIEYDPSENGTEDILSYVNDVSIIEDFASALSDSGEVSFSFDLPALGSTQNIVFQVDDVTSYTGAYFEVMFGFLKFVAFSVMAYKCWEIVVDVHFQKFR